MGEDAAEQGKGNTPSPWHSCKLWGKPQAPHSPGSSVDERLLLTTMYLFAWCHKSRGDFIRAGKRSPCL